MIENRINEQETKSQSKYQKNSAMKFYLVHNTHYGYDIKGKLFRFSGFLVLKNPRLCFLSAFWREFCYYKIGCFRWGHDIRTMQIRRTWNRLNWRQMARSILAHIYVHHVSSFVDSNCHQWKLLKLWLMGRLDVWSTHLAIYLLHAHFS